MKIKSTISLLIFVIAGVASAYQPFTTKELTDLAVSRDGQHGGQCKLFVQGLVGELGGVLGPGYRTAFLVAGTEVTPESASSGDVIQISHNSDPAETGHVHTAIILKNNGDGTYKVVDSNWRLDEIVRIHIWNPQDFVAEKPDWSPHYYRIAESVMLDLTARYPDGTISPRILICHDQFIPNAQPVSNGGGPQEVHVWHSQDGSALVTIQDFYDSAGNYHYAIIDNPEADQAFLLRRGFRWYYLTYDGPSKLGVPYSNEEDWSGPPIINGVFVSGPNLLYVRQLFANGLLLVPKAGGQITFMPSAGGPDPDYTIAIAPAENQAGQLTLTGYATSPTSTYVELSQNTAHPSASSLVLLGNNNPVATFVAGSPVVFSHYPLVASTTYTYILVAKNGSGIELGRSNELLLATPNVPIPTPTPGATPLPNPMSGVQLTGIGFIEPGPYGWGSTSTVWATIKNISSSPVLVERIFAKAEYRNSQGGELFLPTYWPVVVLNPAQTLNPGEGMSYLRLLSGGLPGGLTCTGSLMIYTKVSGLGGEWPVYLADVGVNSAPTFSLVNPATLIPDLALASAQFAPSPVSPLDEGVFLGNVVNVGNRLATASLATVVVSDDPAIYLDVPALEPGGSYPLAVNLGQHQVGTTPVIVWVDTAHDVTESNESNNTVMLNLDVVLAPVVTPTPTPSPPPTPTPTPSAPNDWVYTQPFDSLALGGLNGKDNWTADSVFVVSSNAPFAGGQCLSATNPGGGAVFMAERSVSPVHNGQMSVALRTSLPSPTTLAFQLQAGSKMAGRFVFRNGILVADGYDNDRHVLVANVVANQWYSVTFEIINRDTGRCKLNGQSFGPTFALDTGGNPIDRIRIYALGGATIGVDSISPPASASGPTPTPTPSPSPSPIPTLSPSPTPSSTPSVTPSPSSSPSPTPSLTPTPSASPTSSPTPSASPSPTPSVTPSPVPTVPVPQLVFTGTETYTVTGLSFVRYKLKVVNWQQYPDSLFAANPALVCGTSGASRCWVNIYGKSTSGSATTLQTFCRLGKSSALQSLWFAKPLGQPPPPQVFLTFADQLTNTTVATSTLVTLPAP